jgi:hypothetical protein
VSASLQHQGRVPWATWWATTPEPGAEIRNAAHSGCRGAARRHAEERDTLPNGGVGSVQAIRRRAALGACGTVPPQAPGPSSVVVAISLVVPVAISVAIIPIPIAVLVAPAVVLSLLAP